MFLKKLYILFVLLVGNQVLYSIPAPRFEAFEGHIDSYEDPVQKIEWYIKLLNDIVNDRGYQLDKSQRSLVFDRINKKARFTQQKYAEKLEGRLADPHIKAEQIAQIQLDLNVAKQLLQSIDDVSMAFAKQKSYVSYLWQYYKPAVVAVAIASALVIGGVANKLWGKNEKPAEEEKPLSKDGEEKQSETEKYIKEMYKTFKQLASIKPSDILRKSLKPADVDMGTMMAGRAKGKGDGEVFVAPKEFRFEEPGKQEEPSNTAEQAVYRAQLNTFIRKNFEKSQMRPFIIDKILKQAQDWGISQEQLRKLDLESSYIDQLEVLIYSTLVSHFSKLEDPLRYLNGYIYNQFNRNTTPKGENWEKISVLYKHLMEEVCVQMNPQEITGLSKINELSGRVLQRFKDIVNHLNQASNGLTKFVDLYDEYEMKLNEFIKDENKTLDSAKMQAISNAVTDLIKAILVCDTTYLESTLESFGVDHKGALGGYKGITINVLNRIFNEWVKTQLAGQYKQPDLLDTFFTKVMKQLSSYKL